MSSELENGYIPSKLDVPPRILMFDLDVVAVFFLPLWFFGFILKEFIVAVLASFILTYFFKKIKNISHPKFLKHLMYWYLPSFLGGVKLKSLPDSGVRNFHC